MCRWKLRMLGGLGRWAEGLQNSDRGSGPSGRSSLILPLENQPAGPFVGQVCLCPCAHVLVVRWENERRRSLCPQGTHPSTAMELETHHFSTLR